MRPTTEPAALKPLLAETGMLAEGECPPASVAGSRPLSAEAVLEQLRPWEPTSTGERDGRVRVMLNMACTADGRATVGGRSGPIGNRADRELFHALRAGVDAVLVGAGTVRAERYGRLVRDEAHRRLRVARGLAEEPLACLVTASLDLPPDIPLLADPAARIAVLTPSPTGELPGRATSVGRAGPGVSTASAGESSPRAAPVEYVRAAHDGALDLPAALAELYARLGVRTLLCEGGPHLNGQLFAAGLVDELFLSLAPKLGGGGLAGESPRILSGPEFDPPLELELLGVLESESQLLLRYRVGGSVSRRPPSV
jgi:riboflavin biosynthesis pyrimidine reductase